MVKVDEDGYIPTMATAFIVINVNWLFNLDMFNTSSLGLFEQSS